MPAFTLAAKPMKTINVMKFPLITSYVHQAVADVISAFLAPNAFTMDVSRIIMVGQTLHDSIRQKGPPPITEADTSSSKGS